MIKLLEAGADPNSNSYGKSGFAFLVETIGQWDRKGFRCPNQKRAFELFLEKGANIQLRNIARVSAIMYLNNVDYLQMLIDEMFKRGIDIDHDCDGLGTTALARACGEQETTKMKILLKNGADPEKGTDNYHPNTTRVCQELLDFYTAKKEHNEDVERCLREIDGGNLDITELNKADIYVLETILTIKRIPKPATRNKKTYINLIISQKP